MTLIELKALAARWTEAANARSQYGGEDTTSSALRACAQELEEMLEQNGLTPTNDADLGHGFVTVAKLAEWIGDISESTVRRWLRERKFPGAWQLDNGEWRIPCAAALEFVEQRQGNGDGRAKRDTTTRRYDRKTFVQRFQVKEAT